jgi:RHS repeat-associated protein
MSLETDYARGREIYFKLTQGDGAIITGNPAEIYFFLNQYTSAGDHAVSEAERGLLDKARRDYVEWQRRQQPTTPIAPPKPLKPKKNASNEAPVESPPVAGEDLPQLHGASKVTVDLEVKRQSAEPLPSIEAPSHTYYDQSNPIPAQEVANLLSPPPANVTDFEGHVRRIQRNEPEPGEVHPSHAAPAARKPVADADPVDLFTGAFTINVVDLVIPTPHIPIAMSRSYRSGRPYYGPFGFGWDHVYNVYLRELNDRGIAMWTGQLREQHFRKVGDGFEPEPGLAAKLERILGITDIYNVQFPGGQVWQFTRPEGWNNAQQRIPLTTISDRHGNTVHLSYDAHDRLTSVLEAAGRGLLFHYGNCELLERVTDHTGSRVVSYLHDNEIEHLVRVILPATAQYPKGFSTTYEYDSYNSHPAMQHNILRIHDAEDRLMVENEFAGPQAGWEFNSVVRQRLAGFEYEFEHQQIQYVWPDPIYTDVLAARTLVRRPDGSLHTYTFNYRGDLLDHRFRLNRDGSFRVITSQYKYDAEGNLTEMTAPDGLRQIFTYDSSNDNSCARRNLLRVELAAPISYLVPSRVLFKAHYEPRYQLVTWTEDEIGAKTYFFYDFDDNPVGATGRLSRIQLPKVIGADGAPQQSNLLFEHNVHGQLTATVKPEGGRTKLIYISGGIHDGFLSEITEDPATAGLVSKFEYDAVGFPKQIHAPGGRITGFSYNALGQQEEIVAPEVDGQNAKVRSWFDDSGSIIRLERPAGSFTAGLTQGTAIIDEYERNEIGNVRRVILASNTKSSRQWLQCFDHEGRVISSWDPSGTRSDRVFGEDGSLLSETAAAGDNSAQKTKYIRDRVGRIERIIGPGKVETSFKYDLWGRLESITLPNEAVKLFVFGANDRLLEERVEDKIPPKKVKRPLLQKQTYEYDLRGRLISTTLTSFRDDSAMAVPLKTRYLYDEDDNVRVVLLPRGAQYQYGFDKLGRLTETTDPYGNVRQFGYDASGDLTELTMIEVENGVMRATTCHNIYDARGRLKRSEYLGTVSQFKYDDRDLPIEQIAPSGVTSRIQFDAFGQVIEKLIDPAGLALRSQFEYDLNGRLHLYVDPTNQSTKFERDVLGRAVAVKPPDGTTWEYLTDTNAHTIEQRMPSGNRVVLEYVENENRPVKITSVAAPGQEAIAQHELAYDGMGRLVSASIGSDSVLRRYDSLGRLIEENARGKTVSMEYDDTAGWMDLVFPDGRRERTEHNPAGQPTRIVLVTPGILGGTAGDVLLEIVYSTAGRPVHLIYGNGVEGQLVHDDQGRVIRIEYQKGGVLIDSCRLRYDEAGHRALVQYLAAPARNFIHQFDSHDRLVETRSGFPLAPLPDTTAPAAQAADVAAARIAAAAAPGIVFTLDDADVRTKTTGLNGEPANENYVSTNDHRVTGFGANAISYNPDGTRTGDVRYTYELDALNRVRRVRDRATNAIVTELRYDALSRVVTGATDGQEFERWFAGSTRIHEVSGPAPGTARQHSLHPLWPSPFCVVDVAGPAYIHQDEGWSTMCVTDANGAVLERHRYGVFGASETFAADGVTPLAVLKTESIWRAMPALGNTTLFRTPQRLYDPEVGVFINRDPLLYVDSPSPYVYAGHNPVDFVDPTGLSKSPQGGNNTFNKQSTTDWTTQTEWAIPEPDKRLIQPITNVDTGNRPLNFVLNKILLPWRNLLALYENALFGTLLDIDDAIEHSRFQQEYHAAQVMAPMGKAMGIAVEVGPAIGYAVAWLSSIPSNRRFISANTTVVSMLMGGIGSINSSTSEASLISAGEEAAAQHALRGGAGQRGIGVLYVRDASILSPEELETSISAVRDIDFQAGIAGGLVRQAPGSLRAEADSVASLARRALQLSKTEAAGHIPDVAGGGNVFGPIIGLPRRINSSWGGQIKRYQPGFVFEGVSLVDRATGQFLYSSMALEHAPVPLLPW